MYVKTCFESENRKRGKRNFPHTLNVDVYENILLGDEIKLHTNQHSNKYRLDVSEKNCLKIVK